MTIEEAFKKDGFKVVGSATRNGKTGYVAEHETAINHLDGKKKRAYYLEGNSIQMGYQMGVMANEEVQYMAKDAIRELIAGFIKEEKDKDIIIDIILFIIRNLVLGAMSDIPFTYIQEMHGIVYGVNKVNMSKRKQTLQFEDVLMLNIGMDMMVAFMSNPGELIKLFAETKEAKEKKVTLKESQLQYPHFCNAYSAFAGAVKDPNQHFFGRDWMLNAGDVLENCAALIVVKPTDGRNPLVYAAAPGLVGAALAMNSDGVAMGVDLVPAANSKSALDPGFNSILLVRDSIHRCSSTADVVDHMVKAPRGVPYIYPVADGKTNRSCIVEAGMKVKKLEPLSYVEKDLLPLLPTEKFLNENAVNPVEGLVARWNDYKQSKVFMEKFNEGLFKNGGSTYNPSVWGEEGFVFKEPFSDSNSFGFDYFVPERVEKSDFIIATNSWLTPPMNICSMNEFIMNAQKAFWSDPQWRYDLINKNILANYGKIDWDIAWKIIDLLSPTTGLGEGKKYYTIEGTPWKLPVVKYKDSDGKEQQTWRVDGMTNLCELKSEKKVRSLYGTYADEVVEITLPNYLS